MMSFAAMLMMLLGSGSNDLLDFIHTDSYWKAKQVTVSVEQLMADAGGKELVEAAPADANAAAPQAGQVRRLMAIRTLGEMKKVESTAALKALADAKEPFVADYAAAAIAAIEGKPATRSAASAQDRMIDVWLLPAQCDIVAQIAPSGKATGGGDIFGDVPLPPQANKAEMLEQMTAQVIPIAEMLGNMRLHAATVGLYSNAPDQPGYAVIVARGQYDAKSAAAMLGKNQVTVKQVDGMDVFAINESMAILLPSDTRAVMVTADGDGKLPLEAVVAAIKKDAGDLHDNAEMTKLISTVDTTQAAWGVAKITDGIRQVAPPVAAFDLVTLVISQKDDVLSVLLKAEGADAEKVKATVEEAKGHLQEGITELRQAVQHFPAAKTMLEALESVKLETDGGKVTGTASLKGAISALMFGGVQSSEVPVETQPGKPGGL